MTRRGGFLDALFGKKDRVKARSATGSPVPVRVSLPAALDEITDPRAGLRALNALLHDHYMGHTKEPMTKTILYGLQVGQGYLKLIIEAEKLLIEHEQLELDKKTHSMIEAILERGKPDARKRH